MERSQLRPACDACDPARDRGGKVRVAALLSGLYNNVNDFRVWALDLAEQGPANAYPGFFVNYPPGYLYVIWFVGVIARVTGATGETLRMMVESPPLVADFFLAASVFVLVRGWGRSKRAAWLAMLAFALNPALIYDTLVWGQTDSALALPLFLSIVSALDSEYELAWALGALALLVKPQALLYLPVLGVWTLLRADFRKWWRSALAFAAIIAIAIAPFRIERYFASVESLRSPPTTPSTSWR